MSLNSSNNYSWSNKSKFVFRDLVMNSENKMSMHTDLTASILSIKALLTEQPCAVSSVC